MKLLLSSSSILSHVQVENKSKTLVNKSWSTNYTSTGVLPYSNISITNVCHLTVGDHAFEHPRLGKGGCDRIRGAPKVERYLAGERHAALRIEKKLGQK